MKNSVLGGAFLFSSLAGEQDGELSSCFYPDLEVLPFHTLL